MAKIFYSMAGEGRGHATRVRSIVEELRRRHEIVLFAPGDAHELLSQMYRGSEVKLHRIPGLRFQYRRHRVSYTKTIWEGLKYIWRLPRLLRFLRELIGRVQPDLVITDFEPSLPRAAKQCGVPFISFDHQHFLSVSDFSGLPWALRMRAQLLGAFVDAFYWGQKETIVSSFYFPPLRRGRRNVEQIGVLLRPEILAAERRVGDFLVTYLRRDVPDHVLATLASAPLPVRLYGLGERPPCGGLTFCPVSDEQFMHDLTNCYAVVSTAGNQLVGEALFLAKPVLAMPEMQNYEQHINAHFLAQSGAGEWCTMEAFGPELLKSFLERAETLRANIRPERLNGNPQAICAIERNLPGAAAAPAAAPSKRAEVA